VSETLYRFKISEDANQTNNSNNSNSHWYVTIKKIVRCK
jgi:hypothetical protein